MSTGGQGLQVKSVDVGDLDTGDVPEGLHELDVLVGVHDQRALLDLVSLVPQLALAGSQGLGVDDLLHVFVGAESLQKGDGLVGLLERLESVLNHQRQFGHLRHLVASRLHQRGQRGRRQSSRHGVSSLLDVHLSVPSSVGLQGEAHSSLSDHIAESGLTSARSTRSGDSRNSGHGSTGTPGFG